MAKGNIGLGIDLKETDLEIQKMILKCFADTISSAITKSVNSIESRLLGILSNCIISSPEYQSVVSGQLRGEFGIVDSHSALLRILNIWLNSIKVIPDPVRVSGSDLIGGLNITAIEADFSDVLSSSSASFVTEKGTKIPWLEWLLTAGTNIVVRDYKVSTNLGNLKNKAVSRTGQAIMVSSSVQFYKVPAQFAGTIDDNMVSRAILGVEDIILDMIQEEVEKHI